MSRKQTNVRTRLNELEATVRGLTQELVDANERIRHLETALAEETETRETAADAPVPGGADRNGDGGSKRQMGDDGQTEEEEEAGSDLDGIIVA